MTDEKTEKQLGDSYLSESKWTNDFDWAKDLEQSSTNFPLVTRGVAHLPEEITLSESQLNKSSSSADWDITTLSKFKSTPTKVRSKHALSLANDSFSPSKAPKLFPKVSKMKRGADKSSGSRKIKKSIQTNDVSTSLLELTPLDISTTIPQKPFTRKRKESPAKFHKGAGNPSKQFSTPVNRNSFAEISTFSSDASITIGKKTKTASFQITDSDEITHNTSEDFSEVMDITPTAAFGTRKLLFQKEKSHPENIHIMSIEESETSNKSLEANEYQDSAKLKATSSNEEITTSPTKPINTPVKPHKNLLRDSLDSSKKMSASESPTESILRYTDRTHETSLSKKSHLTEETATFNNIQSLDLNEDNDFVSGKKKKLFKKVIRSEDPFDISSAESKTSSILSNSEALSKENMTVDQSEISLEKRSGKGRLFSKALKRKHIDEFNVSLAESTAASISCSQTENNQLSSSKSSIKTDLFKKPFSVVDVPEDQLKNYENNSAKDSPDNSLSESTISNQQTQPEHQSTLNDKVAQERLKDDETPVKKVSLFRRSNRLANVSFDVSLSESTANESTSTSIVQNTNLLKEPSADTDDIIYAPPQSTSPTQKVRSTDIDDIFHAPSHTTSITEQIQSKTLRSMENTEGESVAELLGTVGPSQESRDSLSLESQSKAEGARAGRLWKKRTSRSVDTFNVSLSESTNIALSQSKVNLLSQEKSELKGTISPSRDSICKETPQKVLPESVKKVKDLKKPSKLVEDLFGVSCYDNDTISQQTLSQESSENYHTGEGPWFPGKNTNLFKKPLCSDTKDQFDVSLSESTFISQQTPHEKTISQEGIAKESNLYQVPDNSQKSINNSTRAIQEQNKSNYNAENSFCVDFTASEDSMSESSQVSSKKALSYNQTHPDDGTDKSSKSKLGSSRIVQENLKSISNPLCSDTKDQFDVSLSESTFISQQTPHEKTISQEGIAKESNLYQVPDNSQKSINNSARAIQEQNKSNYNAENSFCVDFSASEDSMSESSQVSSQKVLRYNQTNPDGGTDKSSKSKLGSSRIVQENLKSISKSSFRSYILSQSHNQSTGKKPTDTYNQSHSTDMSYNDANLDNYFSDDPNDDNSVKENRHTSLPPTKLSTPVVQSNVERPWLNTDFDRERWILKRIEKLEEITRKKVEANRNRYGSIPHEVKKRVVKPKLKTEKPTANVEEELLPKYSKRKPKLAKPDIIATKRLYDYLINILEPKFGIRARIRAEEFVIYLCKIVKTVRRKKDYQPDLVRALKVEMAQLDIIVNTADFYDFVRDYLDNTFRSKVIPCVQPLTNAIWPPAELGNELNPILKK